MKRAFDNFKLAFKVSKEEEEEEAGGKKRNWSRQKDSQINERPRLQADTQQLAAAHLSDSQTHTECLKADLLFFLAG